MTTTGRVARLMAAPSPRLRRLVFRTTTSCPAKPQMRFASHLCCTARVGPGTLPGHTAEPAPCCSLGAGPGASRLKSLSVTLLGSWGRKPRSSSVSGGADVSVRFCQWLTLRQSSCSGRTPVSSPVKVGMASPQGKAAACRIWDLLPGTLQHLPLRAQPPYRQRRA